MPEKNSSNNYRFPILTDNEAKLNEFISLKLENGKTNLYVKNEHFKQCRYLILHIFLDNINELNDIQAIDDLEKRDYSCEYNYYRNIEIPPRDEFWGHCSNLQAWIENNYDTRLLHRNLAFPLLRELATLGDSKARKIIKNEIIERFSSGSVSVMMYLLHEGFLKDFNEEEREYINEGLDKLYTTSFFYKNHYTDQGRDAELFDNEELDGKRNPLIEHKEYSNCWSRLPNIQNKIRDIIKIEELNDLTDITRLTLIQNYISEINGLERFSYLRELALNKNDISEIKNLENLSRLKYLSLPGNKICEIKGLENLKDLEFLNLGDNKIKKIEGLEVLTNLKVLSLWKNKITNIEGFENLKDLRELDLGDNSISEIRGLESLTNLRELMLSGNKISEIKGLDNLKNLRKVTFHTNEITEIKGFDGLPRLEEVTLTKNPIRQDQVDRFNNDMKKEGVKTKIYFW